MHACMRAHALLALWEERWGRPSAGGAHAITYHACRSRGTLHSTHITTSTASGQAVHWPMHACTYTKDQRWRWSQLRFLRLRLLSSPREFGRRSTQPCCVPLCSAFPAACEAVNATNCNAIHRAPPLSPIFLPSFGRLMPGPGATTSSSPLPAPAPTGTAPPSTPGPPTACMVSWAGIRSEHVRSNPPDHQLRPSTAWLEQRLIERLDWMDFWGPPPNTPPALSASSRNGGSMAGINKRGMHTALD